MVPISLPIHTLNTGLAHKKFRMSRKKELQFSPIDVIFNLVENIGLNKIGTRIHSGHGYVARLFPREVNDVGPSG